MLVNRDDSISFRIDEFEERIYFFLYHSHIPSYFYQIRFFEN